MKDGKARRNASPAVRKALVVPEQMNHSTVARMLGRPDEEVQLARARANMPAQQDIAQDEISEQLSPLENLALDADTRVRSSVYRSLACALD